MTRIYIEEAAALVSISLFCAMVAIWAAIGGGM
jgi:hypothetical protein